MKFSQEDRDVMVIAFGRTLQFLGMALTAAALLFLVLTLARMLE